MAKRTVLNEKQWLEANEILLPPLNPPRGIIRGNTVGDSDITALGFSSWLALLVEGQFREFPTWQDADPIVLGSWSRGELCPASDLDVLFCGPEENVAPVVEAMGARNVKFRYRVPQNLEDWCQGVDILEANALLWARPLTHRAAKKLQVQQQKIYGRRDQFRNELLKALVEERTSRLERYDSIANFLEPNIKFGAGALRDLQQAQILAFWFADKFSQETHAFEVLKYYKAFYLIVRQKLHLLTSRDILTAHEQHELSQWLGYDNNIDFMREIQKGLSRVSFHTDWIFERCVVEEETYRALDQVPLNKWFDIFKLFEGNKSILAQYRIRRALQRGGSFHSEEGRRKKNGKELRRIFSTGLKKDGVRALFRSQIISHIIPDFKRIIGHVQHDQYHRYSVDAHIQQAVVGVFEVREDFEKVGKLSKFCQKFKAADWEALVWAALYHDMGKGFGGDHAHRGVELVERDLLMFGLPLTMIRQVQWLVGNHLLLSNAAFRMNAQALATRKKLFDAGVVGKNIGLLAVLTAIDIRATNPAAWTTWKEHLLFELCQVLEDPASRKHFQLLGAQSQGEFPLPEEFYSNLDPILAERLPHKMLLDDFERLFKGDPLPFLAYLDSKKYIWLRYHQPKDSRGLFMALVNSLVRMSCNIRYAAILTDSNYGVYNWFQVKTPLTLKQVEQLQWQTTLPKEDSSQTAAFEKIELMSQSEWEWVFSLRGRDRPGLLMSASRAFHSIGLEIQWAKVHTWGRQIEDVFGVSPLENTDPFKILHDLTSLLCAKL